MTADTYCEALRAIRDHSGLELSSIRDAGRYGADAGWGGFTYYGDTSEFYAANKTLIWQILADDAEEFGHDNVPAFVASFNRADMAEDETGFECLTSWYVLESVGRMLDDRKS